MANSPVPEDHAAVRPLRLAFCITELHAGGAERILCELAEKIDRSRFSVTVYSLQPRPEDDSQSCVPRLEKAGIPVYFLDMEGPWSFFRSLSRLRRMLVRDRPDLFLSFLFHANFLGRLAARWARVPHVVSGIRVAEHRARWHLKLDRWTQGLVDRYLCVSRSVAGFSHEIGKLPPEKFVVIPNGVDVPDPNPAITRENRIISIGRLDYQKGLDWFFETLPDWFGELPGSQESFKIKPQAKEDRKETESYESFGSVYWYAAQPAWELLLVGDGPDRKNLVEQWLSFPFDPIRHRIHFLGWRKNATELLAGSRIFILPSRWEGMPNVLLQAMAAGLPVVATDAEGVEEALGPLAEEQMCPLGDHELFIRRIRELIDDPEQAERLGRENRRRVEEYFSIEKMVRSYEEFFLETIGRSTVETVR